MKQKLEENLFGENMRVYAILDGASVPDLLTKLYEFQPRHFCLYRGEIDADIAEVAPYLVELLPNGKFTDWVLSEGWGKHWGIYVHSTLSLVEMRKHFRTFLTVYDGEGNPMLFRYYDPRVLREFLPTCKTDELKTIFGKVNTYFTESKNKKNLVRFQFFNAGLQETKISLQAEVNV